MILPAYLSDIAHEMRQRSSAIRRDFSSHRLSAGENREDIVAKFLRDHLASRFGIGSGMVISADGLFSNQADLLVTDAFNNSPLYAGASNQLWMAESVYAMIEVKTMLTLPELRDSINKARRFKSLRRNFLDAGQGQRIRESIFAIWAFDSPSAETIKANLAGELAAIPTAEQPDFVVVPDKLVAFSGSYYELTKLGQPGSAFRMQLDQPHGAPFRPTGMPLEVWDMGENALLTWYVWFDSWLRQAGSRLTTLVNYLPPEQIFGRIV